MSEPRSFRFARNLSWNLLAQTALAACTLMIVPVLVSRLGLETYGLYILMQTVSSYLMLMTFGSASAGLRSISYARGRHEHRVVLDAARYMMLLHFFGVLAGAAALWFGADFVLTRVVRLPAAQLEAGRAVLRWAAAGAVFAALTQAASNVLTGYQRFDAQSAVAVLQGGLALGAAALLAVRGFGIAAIAAGWAAANALIAAPALWLAWRTLAPARREPSGPRLSAREFYTWGFSQWLGPLAWIICYQLDKVVVARSATLTGLTLYAVPANLLQRLQIFPALISVVLMPMISELHGQSAHGDVTRIYLRATRLVLWALLPVLLVLFAVMPQFLSLWLGGQFGDAGVWPARLLVAAQGFWLLGTMPGTVVFAKDKPWYIPAYSWAQAIVSLIAWRLLIPRWQILGAAAGSLLAQALPVAAFLAIVHGKVLHVSWGRYAREVLGAAAVSGALALAVGLSLHAQATSWARLIGVAAASAAVFYATTWALMEAEDRGVILRYLRLERGSAKL